MRLAGTLNIEVVLEFAFAKEPTDGGSSSNHSYFDCVLFLI